MNKKIEVKSEERVFDDYLKIDKAIISETDEKGESVEYSRFKLDRPEAVSIILYNSDDDTVILVKQHRYATHGKVSDNIFEIVAGKIDEGEDHEDAARREVEEEVGYKIKEENLIYMSSFFASPGYSSEVVHLYAATVTSEDKVSEGGGLDGEHENIEIVNVPATQFFQMASRGEIVDAKSIIGANALWHLRNGQRVDIGLSYYEKLMKDKSELQAQQNAEDSTDSNENLDANETSK